MSEKQRVSVRGAESIISLGKSARLAAIRKSAEMSVNKDLSLNGSVSSGGDKEGCEVQQAREAIRQRIAQIKATYRQGMRNKLFALRYGSDEEINQMTLKKLFTLLNITQTLAKEFAEKKYRDEQF